MAYMTTGCSSVVTEQSQGDIAANSEGEASGGGAASTNKYGPLRVVVQGGEDWVTAEAAMETRRIKLLDECLTSNGYQVSGQTVDRDRIKRDGLQYAYKTDIADEATRRDEGYRATSFLVGMAPGDEENTPVDAPPDEAVQECSQTTQSQVTPESVREFFKQGWAATKKAQSAPEYYEARSQWSVCMSKAGYPYDAPEDPPQHLARRAQDLLDEGHEGQADSEAAALHDEEIRTAEADWSCREKTITPVLHRLRNDLESEFLEKNPELANRVKLEMKQIITGG